MNQNPDFDPDHQKRLLLAVVICVSIMAIWYFFYQWPLEKAKMEARNKARIEQQFKLAEKAKDINLAALKTPEKPQITREEIIKNSPRIKINNGTLHGSIRLVGARIDDATLANYKETLSKNVNEVVLMSPSNLAGANFIDFGWIASDSSIALPNADTLWTQVGTGELTPKNPVTLTWDNGQGHKFYIKYEIDENYMLGITQRVENVNAKTADFYSFGLISKTESKEKTDFILHTGPMGVMDGTLTEVSYADMKDEGTKEYTNATGWVGITDKYWFKSIIPSSNYKATFRHDTGRYQVDFLSTKQTLGAGSSITYTTKVFVGAKELKVLQKYADDYKIPLFDRAIDFGWFHFLTKPMYYILIYFNGLLGNFGLAILLLTLCVKLALFPLSRKGYISMGKLKQLHPKIVELQKRHKEDKVALQKKMLELYKKEKVNPASGCLPILLQIPIFFSLYKVFFVSIEMRHAPFFGWIKDLSAPDPTTIFNLFGLLPFEASFLPAIGFFPCLMAITMYIQQQLTPTPADPVSAKVIKFMPLMFLFLFHSFPAGLIIYWCFSNTLTILQQLYFLKTNPVKTK